MNDEREGARGKEGERKGGGYMRQMYVHNQLLSPIYDLV